MGTGENTGESTGSNTGSDGGSQFLAVPTSFAITPNSQTQNRVDVTWTPPAKGGATGYNIYSTQAGFHKFVAWGVSGTTVTGLTASTPYTMWIVTTDGTYESGPSNTGIFSTNPVSAGNINWWRWDVDNAPVYQPVAFYADNGYIGPSPFVAFETSGAAHSGTQAWSIMIGDPQGDAGYYWEAADTSLGGSSNNIFTNYDPSYTLVNGPPVYCRWWMKFHTGFSWGTQGERKWKISRFATNNGLAFTGYIGKNNVDGFWLAERSAQGMGNTQINAPVSGGLDQYLDNEWHEYIVMIQGNSTPTSTDGILRIYIDGVQAGEGTGQMSIYQDTRYGFGKAGYGSYIHPQMDSTYSNEAGRGGQVSFDSTSMDSTFNSIYQSQTTYITDDLVLPAGVPLNGTSVDTGSGTWSGSVNWIGSPTNDSVYCDVGGSDISITGEPWPFSFTIDVKKPIVAEAKISHVKFLYDPILDNHVALEIIKQPSGDDSVRLVVSKSGVEFLVGTQLRLQGTHYLAGYATLKVSVNSIGEISVWEPSNPSISQKLTAAQIGSGIFDAGNTEFALSQSSFQTLAGEVEYKNLAFSDPLAVVETVGFTVGGYVASEDTLTMPFSLTRGGTGIGAISVDIYTTDVTANSSNYTGIPIGSPQTVTWADGDLADKAFSIDLFDLNLTSNVSFTLTAVNVVYAGLSIITTNNVPCTILASNVPPSTYNPSWKGVDMAAYPVGYAFTPPYLGQIADVAVGGVYSKDRVSASFRDVICVGDPDASNGKCMECNFGAGDNGTGAFADFTEEGSGTELAEGKTFWTQWKVKWPLNFDFTVSPGGPPDLKWLRFFVGGNRIVEVKITHEESFATAYFKFSPDYAQTLPAPYNTVEFGLGPAGSIKPDVWQTWTFETVCSVDHSIARFRMWGTLTTPYLTQVLLGDSFVSQPNLLTTNGVGARGAGTIRFIDYWNLGCPQNQSVRIDDYLHTDENNPLPFFGNGIPKIWKLDF